MPEVSSGDFSPLGRVVQNAQRPLTLSPERSRFSANIFEDQKGRVHDGMILVAEGPNSTAAIVCRVCRLQSYGDQSAIAFQSIHEFVTLADLEPLRQIVGSSTRPVVNSNLNGYSLRRCRPSEVALVYQLPTSGVPIGQMALDGGSEELLFLLPGDLLYRSAFFCGAKGSGKTTSLKSVLSRVLGADQGGRPAVVVLDVEGEFSETATRDLFPANRETVCRYTISTNQTDATATLSLGQVHFEDFAYFAPNLPLNSMIHLEAILREVADGIKQTGRDSPAREILSNIQQAAWRRPAIHKSQRDAIIRATTSPVFSLFDQWDLKQLSARELAREAAVTILDVSQLTDDQQRVVALYLLSAITRYKELTRDQTGVLIVMDEAQNLFPHKGDLKPEYAERLGKFVSAIVHRGRRRRLGVLLATQYPADVSREVSDLCDTKLVFRMSGSQAWLRATLCDSEAASRVPELPIGHAYITSTGLSLLKPVRVQFPLPSGSVIPTSASAEGTYTTGSSTSRPGPGPIRS